MNEQSLQRRIDRPQVYSTSEFRGFRVVDDRTYPLKSLLLEGSKVPSTLADAVEAAKVWLFHKDTLVIRETDTITGAVKLHLFAIKRQSTPTYVYRDHVQHRVHRLYAAPICVVSGEAFAQPLGDG